MLSVLGSIQGGVCQDTFSGCTYVTPDKPFRTAFCIQRQYAAAAYEADARMTLVCSIVRPFQQLEGSSGCFASCKHSMSGAVASCLACHAVMMFLSGELIIACLTQHVGSKHCSWVLTHVHACHRQSSHSMTVTAEQQVQSSRC